MHSYLPFYFVILYFFTSSTNTVQVIVYKDIHLCTIADLCIDIFNIKLYILFPLAATEGYESRKKIEIYFSLCRNPGAFIYCR